MLSDEINFKWMEMKIQWQIVSRRAKSFKPDLGLQARMVWSGLEDI